MWTKPIPSTLNSALGQQFYAKLRNLNVERELEHVRSGKLSASKLGAPLLEQMLYVLGVPPKPVEDYALGLFRRGTDVEATAIALLEPDETQVEVDYRGVIGYVDAIRNGMKYEVKSVKNSQVKYLDPNNTKKIRRGGQLVAEYDGVKYAHALQATLYGAATNDDYVTVLYIAADDLRPYGHVLSVVTMKDELDRIIDEFGAQMALKMLPAWSPREMYQQKFPQYSNYPDWMSLEPAKAMQKLQQQYPVAYAKLTEQKVSVT